MLFSSLYGVAYLPSFVSSPSGYTLQIYELLFGLTCMLIEAKDISGFDQFRPWIRHWFRFLTVSAGKGYFYLLVGAIGVALWQHNFLVALVGVYFIVMGAACWAVHFGMVSELRKVGIDITDTQAGYPAHNCAQAEAAPYLSQMGYTTISPPNATEGYFQYNPYRDEALAHMWPPPAAGCPDETSSLWGGLSRSGAADNLVPLPAFANGEGRRTPRLPSVDSYESGVAEYLQRMPLPPHLTECQV